MKRYSQRLDVAWLCLALAACWIGLSSVVQAASGAATSAAWLQDDPPQEGEKTKEQEQQGGEQGKAEAEQGAANQGQGDSQKEQGEAAKQEEGTPPQGEAEDQDQDAPPGSRAALLAQWAELNKRIDAKKKAFDEAEDNTARLPLRDEYVALIDEANELVAKIKAAAFTDFDAGQRGEDLLELVVGIMLNDAAFDRDFEVLQEGAALIKAGIDPKYLQAASEAERLSISGKEIFEELLIRQKEAQADDLPRVKLTTSKGEIVLELFENEAPQTVGNFVNLVESGFYDGLKFHRVIEGFMAQGGDPKGDGTGGPGYNIYCECYKPEARRHFTGSLSMAKQPARDTGGSQFFITFSRTSHLDGLHTVFGRVVEGMDVVNSLQRYTPDDSSGAEPDTIVKAEVLRKRDHEYTPTKVGEDQGN